MMTFAYVILTLSAKERLLMQHDPHGVILAATCILFVFAVLLILYCIYGLSGEYFMYRARRQARQEAAGDAAAEAQDNAAQTDVPDEAGIAVAIAVALEMQRRGNGEHDTESGVITIRHDARSKWTRI